MKKKGEYLFQSFKEALNFVEEPTNYEKENNIEIKNTEILADQGDIKLVGISKTDGTSTVAIFFKNSTEYDIWKFWIPSENQFKFLTNKLPLLINIIEWKNKNGGE